MTGRPEHLPISWAQHWEDVRLWRVLRQRTPGFYVDVGAMDPVIDSVTKAFYDHGWHGIDIQPHPAFAAALRSARLRDVVEETAASDGRGSVALHLIATDDGIDTGLSTVVERHARRHATDRMSIRTIDVRTATLTELLAGTEAEDPTTFHFLKVDVEGREAAVLRGQTSIDSGWRQPSGGTQDVCAALGSALRSAVVDRPPEIPDAPSAPQRPWAILLAAGRWVPPRS